MGAKSSPRHGVTITLIAIHTNEGNNPADVFPDRTAENLAAYLDRPTTRASYHYIVDDDSAVNYLPDHVASWSLLSGNSRALNLCMTGWARWSRDEWLQHRQMLGRAAALVRDWCARHKIPPRKLSPVQVGLDLQGICGHVDWTVGKRDGDHTDPGPNFPWDVFIDYVTGGQEEMNANQERMLREVHHELMQWLPTRSGDPGSKHVDRTAGYAASADGYGWRIEKRLDKLIADLPAIVQREVAAALKSLQAPKQ